MEELSHHLFIVELFNKVIGKPIALLLQGMGFTVHNPNHLFADYVVMCFIAFLILTIFFGLASRKPHLVPKKIQSILEMIIQAFEWLLVETVGEEGKKYIPMIATIGLFLLICNLMGLVPGLMSPTSNINVPVGCALVVFVYYHWQGIKTQGFFNYLKHFTGPIPLLAPLMLPIEIISHFSRPVSLSIRLFGNIFAEELLIVVIASIIPFFLPLPFMALAIFTSIIQAFVFIMLACIYIAGAVEQEEEH